MTETPDGVAGEISLRTYLGVLSRRWMIILAGVLTVVTAAAVSSYRQVKIYQTTATLLVQPRSSDGVLSSSGGLGSLLPQPIDTEVAVVESEAVRQRVVQSLKRQVPGVAVAVIGTTNVMTITARSTSPMEAAAVANAYGDAYIEYRRSEELKDTTAAIRELSATVSQLNAQITAVDPKKPADPNGDRAALIQQSGAFGQLLTQLQIGSRLQRSSAQVINHAAVPGVPILPNPRRNISLGFAIGLVLGIAGAFVREFQDDRIKDKDELERVIGGVPTLGMLPTVPGWRDGKRPFLASLKEPHSVEAEAYRTLRTSLSFASLDNSLKTLLVTSGKAGEGKTTTVANLGVALARAGQRVVVVSADLRRPRLHEFFQLPNEVGFTSVLLGDINLTDALQEVPEALGLLLLASGPLPPNPSELLASQRTVELLEALARPADFVIIDSAPLLPVSDPVVLASRVDGVMLVTSARTSTRREIRRCRELLSQVDAPLIGTVLNQARGEDGYGYGYGYGYGDYAAKSSGTADENGNGHKKESSRRRKRAERRG